MHIQKHFAANSVDDMQELIRTRPLATFIVALDNDVVVNHLPLMIDTGVGDYGLIKGHMPRSNPLWERLDGTRNAVAVFHGPEAYVSPSWYPSKREHGKAVPTWNYVTAHAHGRPVVQHDAEWLLAHLHDMTNKQEAAQAQPWKIADAPPAYIAMMLRNIVGIEMQVQKIEGKWKTSQNRPDEDRLAVAAALRERGDANSLAMAKLVEGYKQ